jgi:hypothetical protein
VEEDGHEFPDEYESPAPVHLPGGRAVPSDPRASHHREPPEVVDEPVDVFGAEEPTTALVERLEAVSPSSPPGHRLLSPPYSPERDRVDGRARPPATLGVRLLVESGCRACTRRAMSSPVARTFGRTAESMVTYWPGGIRAGVEVALRPAPEIRVR